MFVPHAGISGKGSLQDPGRSKGLWADEKRGVAEWLGPCIKGYNARYLCPTAQWAQTKERVQSPQTQGTSSPKADSDPSVHAETEDSVMAK